MYTKFVAEVASNHNGNLDRCYEFISAAREAGCWGIKFQLFELNKLFAPEAFIVKPELIERQKWELPPRFLKNLSHEANRNRLAFGCTPFDLDAVDTLFPYVDFYKIASYNILDIKLLRKVAAQGKPTVLSTGAATLAEIDAAIRIMREVNKHLDLTVLHCVSAYPVDARYCNLGMLDRIRGFNVKAGWSDHSVNPGVIYRAVHKYHADMIEFHFDIGNGVDAGTHSWYPDDIATVMYYLQEGELADSSLPKIEYVEPVEETERQWRADPYDGLRPLMSERVKIKLEHAAKT